ncbi:hypothetical protein [Arcobacter sp. LA11]|uniref:hypothetical protein n=1 Tax=Arcobacter sp. LA11 TaxID=1898176 RepID=UPI0009349CEF|nr:hypothetical protein [Arcobacter sp. LA11]
MNIEQASQNIFDSLKRILLYANAGKYNHVMQVEDIEQIKNSINKIVEYEESFNNAILEEEKIEIYNKIKKYKNFSIRDFMEYKIERI